MKNDLTYLPQGLYTTFFPETPAGEAAWLTIATTPGCEGGRVLTIHLVSTIRQIKRAGLTVAKARRVDPSGLDAILEELGEII